MIQLEHIICAESVVRDAATNSISVFNIIEEINAVSFPVVVPKLSVVVISRRDESDPQQFEGQLRFKLGDQVVFEGHAAIDFQGTLRNRQIMVLQGFIVSAPGILRIECLLDEREIGFTSIPVRVISQQLAEVYSSAAR